MQCLNEELMLQRETVLLYKVVVGFVHARQKVRLVSVRSPIFMDIFEVVRCEGAHGATVALCVSIDLVSMSLSDDPGTNALDVVVFYVQMIIFE